MHLEVERAERGRLRARGGHEGGREDREEVRRERDVGVRVPREVHQGARDLEVEGVRARVGDQSGLQFRWRLVRCQQGVGGNALDSPKADLHQRVQKRLQLALLPAPLRPRLRVARTGQHDRPEVNAVHILPVVYLFVRLLLAKSRHQIAAHTCV